MWVLVGFLIIGGIGLIMGGAGAVGFLIGAAMWGGAGYLIYKKYFAKY